MTPASSWTTERIRQFNRLVGRMNAGASLEETLQAVVDGVVEIAGFEVAAINYRLPGDNLIVVAVAGRDDARAALLGVRQPLSSFDAEFAAAEHWGELRFVPHDRVPQRDPNGSWWVPDLQVSDDPGAWHPEDALFAPLKSPSGELQGILSVDLPVEGRRPGDFQREILELYAAQAGIAITQARLMDQLVASEQAFRLAFESAGIGMTVLSITAGEPSRYLRVNGAFCNLVGYSEEQLLDLGVADITHPDDLAQDAANISAAFTSGDRQFSVEKRYQHAGGGMVWVCVSTSVIEDARGNAAYAISQVQDVSSARQLREELTRDALQDSLTGLPNRRALDQRLESWPAQDSDGRDAYVLFCDLDGFKAVNDQFGHGFGDLVLRALSKRLRRVMRPKDMVVRLGGDEFVVLAVTSDVEALAQRLTSVISEPVTLEGTTVAVTTSIGISSLRDVVDAHAAIHDSDVAMYEVKRSGGDGYALARSKPGRN